MSSLTWTSRCTVLTDPRARFPAWLRDSTKGREMLLWTRTFGRFSSSVFLQGAHRALTGKYSLTSSLLPASFFLWHLFELTDLISPRQAPCWHSAPTRCFFGFFIFSLMELGKRKKSVSDMPWRKDKLSRHSLDRLLVSEAMLLHCRAGIISAAWAFLQKLGASNEKWQPAIMSCLNGF